MNLKQLNFLIFFMLLLAVACTPYKDVPYMQDLKNDPRLVEKIGNFSPITIQNGDILSIHVASLNPDADGVFNNNAQFNELHASSTGSPIQRVDENAATGYLVDNAGDINLPLIGLLHVSGYTTHEATVQIQSKLEKYLSKPIINVRITNFVISVMGDVKTPGTFTVQSEKINLMQGLSLANDLNTTGVRDIILIREQDGNRSFIHLDLKSKNIFDSPYFYLKSNDIIYVRPNKARVDIEGVTIYDKIAILLSGVSIILFSLKQ
jgi:polysaccharide export outer membrane protein